MAARPTARAGTRRYTGPSAGGFPDWRWHRAALDFGCIMSINPDAHSIRELDHTHWGVEMARKGGVPPERILNCLNIERFSEYLSRRRESERIERLAG